MPPIGPLFRLPAAAHLLLVLLVLCVLLTVAGTATAANVSSAGIAATDSLSSPLDQPGPEQPCIETAADALAAGDGEPGHDAARASSRALGRSRSRCGLPAGPARQAAPAARRSPYHAHAPPLA